MPHPWDDLKTEYSEAIAEALRPHFDRVEAYEVSRNLVRVMVVHGRFRGRGRMARFDDFDRVEESVLTEDQRYDIHVYLFSPEEYATREGEHIGQLAEFESGSPIVDPTEFFGLDRRKAYRVRFDYAKREWVAEEHAT